MQEGRFRVQVSRAPLVKYGRLFIFLVVEGFQVGFDEDIQKNMGWMAAPAAPSKLEAGPVKKAKKVANGSSPMLRKKS